MLKRNPPDYFLLSHSINIKPFSIFLFIPAAFIAWEINILGQMAFPSSNLLPYFLRITITLILGLALFIISGSLFKYNDLSVHALGLNYKKMPVNLGKGFLIGILTMVILSLLLYLFMPFHFIKGPLCRTDLWKESCSYLLGNTLEELMFRGFLLIIFSQLTNWRVAVIIMALPFGLFHLQGIGMNIEGLKMVSSTMIFSLVFSFAFILTGSMWTSIGTHVITNIILHPFLGLDGSNKSLYLPDFYGAWPKNYDLGFWILLMNTILMATIIYFSILSAQRRNKNS